MKLPPAAVPARLTVLALAALLAACASTESLFEGDKVDYRSGTSAAKPKPLDVPPDLTQLARDTRYQSQGGVISAAATPGAPAPDTAASATVAPLSRGGLQIERDGNSRWLAVPMSPEQLWPKLKAFWQQQGLTLTTEDPQTGILQTDWAENRSQLPHDFIRSTLGRLVDGLYDTGERDRYRTRVERTATGSEIYITHQGLQEVQASDRVDDNNAGTAWRPRPSDPSLEAEMLSRLMLRLAPQETLAAARTAVADAAEPPARSRALPGPGASLSVDEPFDRAWRRVGLALDRSGFSVEDRDRTAGIYYVRYVEPKYAGKDEPSWWARLWGDKTPLTPERYRVVVKGEGNQSTVSVLAGTTGSAPGEGGPSIVERLVKELR